MAKQTNNLEETGMKVIVIGASGTIGLNNKLRTEIPIASDHLVANHFSQAPATPVH